MYYLQIILGAIILTAIAVPLSNNYKAIKAKNIVAAMGAMVLFAFILLILVSITASTYPYLIQIIFSIVGIYLNI